ncbi:hypothetical protein [Labrys sp. 22185]|uniref:hypothetical protein n=1 Tax=Labrys sp. 22185 TaxID=3453888 RepID=UPI003F843C6D
MSARPANSHLNTSENRQGNRVVIASSGFERDWNVEMVEQSPDLFDLDDRLAELIAKGDDLTRVKSE